MLGELTWPEFQELRAADIVMGVNPTQELLAGVIQMLDVLCRTVAASHGAKPEGKPPTVGEILGIPEQEKEIAGGDMGSTLRAMAGV